jgi:ribonuclease P protein component
MLPASARLRKSSDISAVMKSGARFSAKLVVLHVAQSSSEHTKFAFAVGKNVGNSVVRHKVTRQLRHAITPLIGSFPTGSYVVVRALPEANQASFAQISENLKFVISKLAKP